MRYSIKPRDELFFRYYDFSSFVKNMGRNIGKNISKNLTNIYSQNLLNLAKKLNYCCR